MTLNIKYIKDRNFKEPMVILPLKQYEALMEYLEEAEDLFDIKKRQTEKNVSKGDVEKKFKRKFHVK